MTSLFDITKYLYSFPKLSNLVKNAKRHLFEVLQRLILSLYHILYAKVFLIKSTDPEQVEVLGRWFLFNYN